MVSCIINHINYDFSTVHYLNFKNRSCVPDYVLKNPAIFAPYSKNIRPEMYMIYSNPSKILDNSYLYEWFTLPVKEDDMIIFPAALRTMKIAVQGPTKRTKNNNINKY